jgi:membrane fusion protein (multidrug efflux system)
LAEIHLTDPRLRDETRDPPREAPAELTVEKPRGTPLPGALGVLRRNPIKAGVGAIAVVAALAAGVVWYLHARHYDSSDDAFIDGRPVYVELQVSGVIEAAPVTDNQIVKAGDLLVRIDARDYQAAVDLAAAQMLQAEAGVASVRAQMYEQVATISEVGRTVVEAQAALDFSKQENTRYQELVAKGAGTEQRAQQSASDLDSKRAALSAAQFGQSAAQRQRLVLDAQEKSAEAALATAKAQKEAADANLSRVELRATTDGRVTKLTAVAGQLVTPGQAVMILVPLEVWVTANFKETKLTDIRPGQKVAIYVDAYGRNFPGHVDSIQAGSGTVFSLLPAENATGNYVKVVQRIPVKITFDRQPDALLGLGMSVEPTVTVR